MYDVFVFVCAGACSWRPEEEVVSPLSQSLPRFLETRSLTDLERGQWIAVGMLLPPLPCRTGVLSAYVPAPHYLLRLWGFEALLHSYLLIYCPSSSSLKSKIFGKSLRCVDAVSVWLLCRWFMFSFPLRVQSLPLCILSTVAPF